MRLRAAVLRESGNGTRVSAAAAVTPAELLFSAGNYSAAAGAVLTVRPTGARFAYVQACPCWALVLLLCCPHRWRPALP